MKRTTVLTAILAVMVCLVLLPAGGCIPKVPGFFGDEPVDAATFERQAVKRRGQLEIEGARLAAELEFAESAGDLKSVAAVKADIAQHDIERKTYNELYGAGVADLERQSAGNAEAFTALTAVGEIGAASVGLPPGVSQTLFGVLLALAGRAGWMNIRKTPTLPPERRSTPPATTG